MGSPGAVPGPGTTDPCLSTVLWLWSHEDRKATAREQKGAATSALVMIVPHTAAGIGHAMKNYLVLLLQESIRAWGKEGVQNEAG